MDDLAHKMGINRSRVENEMLHVSHKQSNYQYATFICLMLMTFETKLTFTYFELIQHVQLKIGW